MTAREALPLPHRGGTTIHTHFKMEGSWHPLSPRGDAGVARATRRALVLENDRAVAVGFRLASEVFPTEDEELVLGHLGPDVLGPDWDEEEALDEVEAERGRPIGDVLLDQTVMAGPGNVYKSEICFLRAWTRSSSSGTSLSLPRWSI